MVPRGGLEPPTHGFSVPDDDIIEAFLDGSCGESTESLTLNSIRYDLYDLQVVIVIEAFAALPLAMGHTIPTMLEIRANTGQDLV